MGTPGTPQPDVFHSARPQDLRTASRSHPLAYVIRRLPAALEELAPGLELSAGDRVLDYGCADMPYRRLLPPGAEYVPADLAGNPSAEVEIAPGGALPQEDSSFDAVLSTQVLEHVNDPRACLGECFRVLKPGGRMLLSTHGIMVYHPDPVDLWRWTCAGLRREVSAAGFEVERFEGVMGLAATGVQLFQDGALPRVPRRLRGPFIRLCQATVALADRLDTDERRRSNALVFALVARRPG